MGRPKGSLNRRDQTLRAFLGQKGFDPKQVLLDLMQHEIVDIKIDAAKALMPYCYPKLSSVEVTGNMDITSTIGIEPEAVSAIAKIISSRKS